MEVVKAPDKRLRTKTKPVKNLNHGLLQTTSEMVKLTQTFSDPEGVGLAATQVGHNQQYFVFKQKDGNFLAVFNPKILSYSKKTKNRFEGCLSIPDYYGDIKRPIWVKVSFMDHTMSIVTKVLTGVEAWIFQHEFDHLQGRLFVDRVLEQKSKLYKVIGRDRTGAEIFEEVRI